MNNIKTFLKENNLTFTFDKTFTLENGVELYRDPVNGYGLRVDGKAYTYGKDKDRFFEKVEEIINA